MFRNFPSVDKLLENGSQHVWSGLFVLGEEIAIQPRHGISFASLIAEVINHYGANICLLSVTFGPSISKEGGSYLKYVFPTPGSP